MRWNWCPDYSRCVLLDCETQSAADLRTVGARRYMRHESTRPMSLVALLASGEVVVWVPPGCGPSGLAALQSNDVWPDGYAQRPCEVHFGTPLPDTLVRSADAGHTFVAHNAPFDADAWELLTPPGTPQPAWCDSMPGCRAAGLPAGLDKLGQVFTGRGKDASGQRAMKMLCKATWNERDAAWQYPVGSVALWREMLQYNVADVLLLQRVWEETRDYGESDVLDVHGRINSRGVCVDSALLSTLRDLWARQGTAAADALSDATDGELGEHNIRSTPQVRAYLRKLGLDLSSLNRTGLERFFDDPESFFDDVLDGDDVPADVVQKCVAVLRLRQQATRISGAKLQRIAEMCDSDGRVRDVLVYHGAHTGRWTGRGFQPHNLPRGVGYPSDLKRNMVQELTSAVDA